MLTNTGLVRHAQMALTEKWGYVWGTFGQVLTPLVLRDKIHQYPTNVGMFKEFISIKWLNKRTADCVGLIKSYVWWSDGEPSYRVGTDVGANGMYVMAQEKGIIANMPNTPGICVWKDGHIGIYIGDGQVIEAHGTKLGVIQTPLTGVGATPWTHWLKCPFIKYEEVITVPDNYIEIIGEVSNGSVDRWIKGITAIKSAAKAEGNLGDLEIFEFLPELIVAIAKKYSEK